MNDVLTGDQRAHELRDLLASGWRELEGRDAIGKQYRFRNFSEAWGWMSRVALAAEKADHHPEWRNVYRDVEVVLNSHDAGGVTERDVRLARRMDRIREAMQPPAKPAVRDGADARRRAAESGKDDS